LDELNDPTYSSVDTPASHSAQQENDKANKTHGIYGPSVSEPYAFFDPDTHSLRMCEGTLVLGFPEYSQTLPVSGSMQSGRLFQQLRLVHHTKETGYSLWPTPRANQAMASKITPEIAWNPKRKNNLETAVGRSLWPTMTCHGENTATTNQSHVKRMAQGMKYSSRLSQAVAITNPNDVGYLNPLWVEWLMGFPPGWTDLED
jgi:hypothetical protein